MKKVVVETLIRLIEGHAALKVFIDDSGNVIAQFCNLEGSRFITSVMRGKAYYEAPILASRICGFCFAAHVTASTLAVEDALGIEVTDDVYEFRNMFMSANHIQSHVLHLVNLTLTSYKNLYDVFKLPRELREVATDVYRASTNVMRELGGRAVHVVSLTPGGFTKRINGRVIEKVVNESFGKVSKEAEKIVDEVLSIEVPELEAEGVVPVTLDFGGKLRLCGRSPKVVVSNSVSEPRQFYRRISELAREYSTSKHVLVDGKPAITGAVVRLIVHGTNSLSDRARSYAERIKLTLNPFNNIYAQAVEILHFIDTMLESASKLIDARIEPCEPKDADVSGSGVGVVEAPRGVLVHACRIERGYIRSYVVVTPTAINSRNIEVYAEAYVKKLLKLVPRDKLKLLLEDFINAYDPCMSCAVSLDHVTSLSSVTLG